VVITLGITDCDPDTGRLPFQPPEAEQEVALVADQLRVEDWPWVIVVGLAVKLTVGGGGPPEVTVTVTDCVTFPLDPVQVSI
jgi:hypothetical protein